VIVLALVDTARTKLPAAELLLGARAGKFPVAPQPGHNLNAAAEQVILATGRQEGSKLAHVAGRDPVQRLRRQWGQRLIVFPNSSPQS
jgi:hypothetical protein